MQRSDFVYDRASHQISKNTDEKSCSEDYYIQYHFGSSLLVTMQASALILALFVQSDG